MTDELTWELLSRHLDGDLEEAEARALDERLAAEPELRAIFEEMQGLRNGVRELAAAEQSPAELDRLLEPLRRSTPPRRVMRPVFRWLAAAAVIAFGVTVGLEVKNRFPGPTGGPLPRPLPTPAEAHDGQREYFQIKPLPSSEEDQELVGMADRLLASPPPEPALEEPPPLEVLGPLPEGEVIDEVGREGEPAATAGRAIEKQRQAAPGEAEGPRAGLEAPSSAVSEAVPSRRMRDTGGFAAGASSCELSLALEGGTVSSTCSGRPALAPGRYEVVVEVTNGAISRITPAPGRTASEAWQRAIAPLLEQPLNGVNDGSYRGYLAIR